VNEETASRLVSEIEAAWNSHDMTRFAACFAADADFVNVVGAWWRGRDQIEKEHAVLHADRFKHSRMRLELAAFKEIGTAAGVLHVRWQLEGHTASGPSRTTATRRGIWSWTVRDDGDSLVIVSSQNTDVLGAAPASTAKPSGSS
jgi:uncharacterized protein (TIGR02246 family)